MQRSSYTFLRRFVKIVLVIAFILLYLQLEIENRDLHKNITELHDLIQANSQECEMNQSRFGELAKRIAQMEFKVDNLPGPELIDIEAALQIAVRAIELPPGAQPYQLEDVIYIPDANNQNIVFPKGPAWQFTLQVQRGHFIVSVSAVTRKIIFINEIR